MKVKKSRLSFFDKIVLWLNYLLAVCTLLSYLAPVTDPKTAWYIAFFGLAYPVLLLFNLLFIGYWAFCRRWQIVISMICIAVGYNVLLNNIQFHRNKDYAAASGQLIVKIMTYNVHDFKRYGSANDISTKHEILQVISGEQPDVIGIQEFYTRKAGQYDMRDSVMKIMGTTWYYYEPVLSSSQESIGLAIFSKFPIIAHGMVPITDRLSQNTCLYIDVKKDSRIFRVYSLHLQSIRFDPEDYKNLNDIAKRGKVDETSVKRLGGKLKTAFIKRSNQVLIIKKHAAQCPYPYIISGDFNDTPSSYAVNQMAKGLKNAFREQGSGMGKTYNGDFPNYQIDYIMASPAFDVKTYNIIQKKLSDHYPVRSDLLLK